VVAGEVEASPKKLLQDWAPAAPFTEQQLGRTIMSRAFRGLYKRFTTSGEYTWYIDKYIKRVGRLCESTGTADCDEAERYLLHRIRELRDIAIYGVRPRRKFHEAAAKYLTDFALKSNRQPHLFPFTPSEEMNSIVKLWSQHGVSSA
jgi:hypothetical protein